jgi:hypothetical protein
MDQTSPKDVLAKGRSAMTSDPAKPTREQIQAQIAWLDREIADNPDHPTNIHLSVERSKLRAALKRIKTED